MKRKIWKRVIAAGIVLSMGIALSGNHLQTVSASSITEAQEEKDELEKALKQVQTLIDELQTSQGDVEESIQNLNQQLIDISAKITSLEKELTEKSNDIVDTQAQLQEAQEDAATQYEEMKVRIQFMYEHSTDSYLEMLISAQSFSEFLNAVEYIAAIQAYDRNKLSEYEDTIAYIADAEELLKQEYAELEDMKAEVETQKQSVAALMEQKEVQLASIESDLSSAVSDADYYAAEIQAQDEMIAQIQAAEAAKKAAAEKAAAEKAAQEAAKKTAEEAANQNDSQTDAGNTDGNTDGNTTDGDSSTDGDTTGGDSTDTSSEPEYNGGAFRWPCPSSTRITSEYGPRNSPTAGASSNHKGIDIGASYGADIVAAADGRVVTASYSSSGGNYVMIDHGNGLYTVYMHASSLCVSSGQAVSAGDVVAKVGSTGISTGNHLHFGVSLNGSYVSPWNYLSRP